MLLNESAALDVILASRTATARAIYQQVKQVFMVWWRGKFGSAPFAPAAPSLEARVVALEHALRGSVISASTLRELDRTFEAVAQHEFELGDWHRLRAARSDAEALLRRRLGWQFAWAELPAPFAQTALARARSREARAPRAGSA
jgi:hypothetical protein